MNPARIAELLQPFLGPLCPADDAVTLSESQLNNISTYIDILLRWNGRVNLTSVRDEENIVTRHFGESIFAARHLFPTLNHVGTAAFGCPVEQSSTACGAPAPHLIDLGSGAGFPGLPIKLWAPHIHLTLIESNHKKATFLREVIRKLALTEVEVFAVRAQAFDAQGDVVTLRAVERFDDVLPTAAKLVAPGGKLALLIGEQQTKLAKELAVDFTWESPQQIPGSQSRMVSVGTKAGKQL